MRKSGDSRRQATAIAAATMIAGGLIVSAQQTPPGGRPVFRSGVELVTVDVHVIDRQGQSVRGLAPSDFTVTVEGQTRRVVSAEFVDIGAAATAPAALATISTNEGAALGRQVVFVVDQGTLETSSARYVARAASRFFSQLTFADRTGLAFLPVGNSVSLTWSHEKVREALQQLTGMSQSVSAWEYGSLSEARDIANRNMVALRTVGERECGNAVASGRGGGGGGGGGGGTAPPTGGGTGGGAGGGTGGTGGGGGGSTGSSFGSGGGPGMDSCTRAVQMQAESTWRMAQLTSLSSLASLRQVLDTLARVRGDKTVILISGGWSLEQHDEISSLRTVATAAAAARVTVLPIFVPVNRNSASRRSMSPNPGQDQNLQSGPLQMLASMTGGDFYRAEVSAEGVFDRISREMAGYYRVGVEKEPGDLDGKDRRLKVAVARGGTTVRARDVFDVRTYEDRNWTARLAAALDSPIPADGIPLRVTSYVTPNAGNPALLTLVLAGAARRIQPGETTIQVVVRDLDGKKVLVGEPPQSDAIGEGLEFSMNVPIPPGSYVVRVGVMDSAGQVGSVEHRVDARRVPVGALSATGLLLVRVPAGTAAEPRIALGAAGQDERLALEIGLDADRQQTTDPAVVFEIARALDGPALINAPAAVSGGQDSGSYLAQAVADLRVLPPGDYVARAKVSIGGAAAGELHRWFAVTGKAPTTLHTGEVPAPMPAAGAPAALSALVVNAVQPFAIDQVLAPQVLGGFLDRLAARPDAAAPAVRELIERARTDGVTDLTVSNTLAASSPVAAFLRGTTLLSARRFDEAAASFRGAMRTAPDLFPAMVYLGACYAAGGKDKDAAAAWQTALIGTGDAVVVHRLLTDALLRMGSNEGALKAVDRARAKWPEDPALSERFVVAALLGGKRADGLQTLDALLDKGEDVDEPTIALALLVLYDAFEQRQPIAGVEADKARMIRLAERYRARGGPSLPLVEIWVAAVTK